AEPPPGQVSRHRVELGWSRKQECELPREQLHLLREHGPRRGTVARDLRESDRVDKPAGRNDQRDRKKAGPVRSKREPEERQLPIKPEEDLLERWLAALEFRDSRAREHREQRLEVTAEHAGEAVIFDGDLIESRYRANALDR